MCDGREAVAGEDCVAREVEVGNVRLVRLDV